LYRTDPAVAPALDRLNEDWVVGGVAKGVAQTLDGAADGPVEIDVDVGRPKCLAKFLVSHDRMGTAQQQRQHAEREILEANLDAIASEFASAEVGFENTKADNCRRRLCGAHKKSDALPGEPLSVTLNEAPELLTFPAVVPRSIAEQ
jgi:hypothetical protein